MVALTDFTVAFEMATGSTPKTSAPSYTALTSYVMAGEGITLSRGRQSEQAATAQAGRANVTLRNTDNRFTMGNGASPYAPLQLRRPCRFRVTYSATTYDLWQGFVDDWGNGRQELTGVARLSLSDRIARAAKAKLSAAAEVAVRRDSPSLLYALSEPEGSLVAHDTSGNNAPDLNLIAVGSGLSTGFAFGTSAVIGPDSTTAATFTPVGSDGLSLYTANLPAGSADRSSGALGVFVKVDYGTADSTALVAIQSSSTNDYVELRIQVGGEALAQIGLGSASVDSGTMTFDDGEWHHLAARWSTSGTTTVELLVDGVSYGTASAASSAAALDTIQIGGLGTNTPSTGSLAYVAVYADDIGATALAEHAAALTSWAGETTSARFARHCAAAGLPSAFYATSGTTEKPMGPQPTLGKSLLDALNECATAEGGVAYVSDTGVLTLATAGTRYNTAVGLTLDATKAGQVSADTEIPTTDQDLINDSTATRYGGPTFRTTDTASVDAYDPSDESETLYLALDAHAVNWTQWRVAQFADPAPRLNEIPVNVVGYANSGGNVANLLNAEIGTKLRVSNLPADVSATTSLDLMIEGIRDEIRKNEWVRTFTTSPIGLNDTVWILGTDLLGVGTVLGY